MASASDPAVIAQWLLELFRRYRVQSGEVLPARMLHIFAAKHGLHVFDLAEGLEHGFRQGWFADGERATFRLTEAGFQTTAGWGPDL